MLAEANLARQQATLAQRATSRGDFDSAEATVRQTRAQIAALEALIVGAEASVETARVNLDYTRITAPIDGTVLATVVQGRADGQRGAVRADHRRARPARRR